MSTKYKPGEWQISGDAIINGRGTICVLWKPDKFTGGTLNGNLQLIRNAPKLLELLKQVMPSMRHYHRCETASANIDDITRREQWLINAREVIKEANAPI